MDESLEALGHKWLETRNPDDQQRYLEAQRDAGVLRRSSVEVAAWLGDPVARGLLGARGDLFRPPAELEGILQLLPGDEGVKGQAALAVLRLLKLRAEAQAAEHPIGRRLLRALDCPDTPTVERLLTAHAGAKRTVDAVWRDMIGLAQDCLTDQADVRLVCAAIKEALYPWVLVRPDPGGAPLEEPGSAPPMFAAAAMTVEAAQAVLRVPAYYPYDGSEGKELIRDYLLALGWARDVSGLAAPTQDRRLKFDMTARRLVLSALSDGTWEEERGLPLYIGEIAGRLVLEAEDALRAAVEPHPLKRAALVRRRRAGEARSAAWTKGGPPTLRQLDQIAELQRGMSDAEFLELLREAADVESVGRLGRETAGKVILVLSGLG